MWKENMNVRTNADDVKKLLEEGRILYIIEADKLMGSITCNTEHSWEKNDDEEAIVKVGELGMIAVREDQLEKGYGRMLVVAAEDRCRAHGCHVMQLQLLRPADWEHDFKVWLDKWYRRMGYVPGKPETIPE